MNLRGIVGDALESIEIPENIVVDKTKLGRMEAEVDPQMMKRVLINILTNAVDTMPSGGSICIECREEGAKKTISISDTGKGIPEDVLELIWTPLFTTKAKGMGFGLSICKKLLECQGGSISVESTEGKGTTFTISLPT